MVGKPGAMYSIRREALRLYSEGVKCQAIATELNIHNCTLHRWVKNSGTPMRGARGGVGARTLPLATKEMVIRMYADGRTLQGIAGTVGIHLKTVGTWARAAGLPYREQGTKKAKVCALLSSGLPRTEIALRAGCSLQYVYQVCVVCGFDVPDLRRTA